MTCVTSFDAGAPVNGAGPREAASAAVPPRAPGRVSPRRGGASNGSRSAASSRQASGDLVAVHDGGALVLDVVETGVRRDLPRLPRDDPQLEPERLRAGGDGLARDVRAELRPAEDVDEVDRLVDLCERGD